MNFEQLAKLIELTCYFLIGSISLFTLIGLYIVFWDSLIDSIESFLDWVSKPSKTETELSKMNDRIYGHRSLIADNFQQHDELKKKVAGLENILQAQKEIIGQDSIRYKQLRNMIEDLMVVKQDKPEFRPKRKTVKRKK